MTSALLAWVVLIGPLHSVMPASLGTAPFSTDTGLQASSPLTTAMHTAGQAETASSQSLLEPPHQDAFRVADPAQQETANIFGINRLQVSAGRLVASQQTRDVLEKILSVQSPDEFAERRAGIIDSAAAIHGETVAVEFDALLGKFSGYLEGARNIASSSSPESVTSIAESGAMIEQLQDSVFGEETAQRLFGSEREMQAFQIRYLTEREAGSGQLNPGREEQFRKEYVELITRHISGITPDDTKRQVARKTQ